MIARNASHLPGVLGGLCHSPLPVVREQRFEDRFEGAGKCGLRMIRGCGEVWFVVSRSGAHLPDVLVQVFRI